MTQATSESTLQGAIQTTLLGVTATFSTGDVVINDYTVLDKAVEAAPFVIIMNSDSWSARQDSSTQTGTWNIPIRLITKLGELDWETALNNFRDARQTIINTFVGSTLSANGLSGVTVNRVYNGGDINYIYEGYVDPEQLAEATPVFISQDIILETELF